jgi:hypothetical protein
VSRRLEKHAALTVGMAPRLERCEIERDYDLFYFQCMDLTGLDYLAAVPDWRRRSRLAVCRIEEAWAAEINKYRAYNERHHAEVLRRFDLVVTGCSGGVGALAELAGPRCVYAPIGVDTLTFCPAPPVPTRSIDVFGMGRRAPATHQALLQLAHEGRIFYMFDTVNRSVLLDHKQHRFQLASFIKRAKCFVAYKGKVDMPEQTGGQEEIGFRFFEGAAGGAVVIGEAPGNGEFARQFDWPDALVPLPFGAREVAPLLAELERDQERVQRIRRQNVLGILRRHDIVHRWEEVLGRLSLEPTEPMKRRKDQLRRLTARVAEA